MSATERRIAQLEQENHELRELMKKHLRAENLEMESGVSSRTGKPFMHMRWGDQAGQFSPDEARDHAVKILDAAAAAEFDAALIKALTDADGMNLDHETAIRFLGLMREARGGSDQASRAETGPQPS